MNKVLYRKGGRQLIKGFKCQSKVAKGDAEIRDLLSRGWYETPGEAKDEKALEPAIAPDAIAAAKLPEPETAPETTEVVPETPEPVPVEAEAEPEAQLELPLEAVVETVAVETESLSLEELKHLAVDNGINPDQHWKAIKQQLGELADAQKN